MSIADTGVSMPFTLGYGTNGFVDHPLPIALEIMAEEGYGAVALTLGHPHLDPFASDLDIQLAALRRQLATLGLRVVIETGTRYLLDPRHKHRPTLVDEEADSRVVFLRRAVEIASALEAECVSFFSGVLPADSMREQGWVRLVARVSELVQFARGKGVVLSIEPEPGMLVETVADALRLLAELGHPDELRVTVDIGHCVVVEPDGVRHALLQCGSLLANVQLDDMLAHAHEHLPFGQGEVDLAVALSTLDEIGYRGVAAVELPRHSFDAPGLASRSMKALRTAWSDLEAHRKSRQWLTDAKSAIQADPDAATGLFAVAGRRVGRLPLHPGPDPSGMLFGFTDDAARRDLLSTLARVIQPAELAAVLNSLYYRGDSAERRGVLRALGALASQGTRLSDDVVSAGTEITADALRTNDGTIVAAAAGPFAAAHLDQHSWRQAVIKLVFMGISLEVVADLQKRADMELARMASDFADERRAAGRSVPEDIDRLLESSCRFSTG